jgi:hypothetical protein
MLKEKLTPQGVFMLTTKNVARATTRLYLLSGRNIYPWLDGDLTEDDQRVFPYREYTLREVEGLVSKAGFRVIEGHHIIGKKAIDSYFPMGSMPIGTYLIWKIYYLVQKIVPPLRSHFFVVARNILFNDKRDEKVR